MIMRAHEDFVSGQELDDALDTLLQAQAADDREAIKAILERVVTGYQPWSESPDVSTPGLDPQQTASKLH
jgi:hypothetical protein